MSARPPVTCVAPPAVMPERQIELSWDDGQHSRYHFVWLRQQHFHPAIGRPDQQPGDPLRLPDEPASLQVRNAVIDDGMLVVVWDNDGAETPSSAELASRQRLRPRAEAGEKASTHSLGGGSGPQIQVARLGRGDER